MKTLQYIIVIIAAVFCSMLASCANGPLTKQQAAANALADAAAAATGFMAGGQAGALLGLSTQEVKNLAALAEKAKAQAAVTSIPATAPAPSTLLPTVPTPTAP